MFPFVAEIGDFIIEEYYDHTYLSVLSPFVPNQTEEMLKKVAEYHKQHMYVLHLFLPGWEWVLSTPVLVLKIKATEFVVFQMRPHTQFYHYENPSFLKGLGAKHRPKFCMFVKGNCDVSM